MTTTKTTVDAQQYADAIDYAHGLSELKTAVEIEVSTNKLTPSPAGQLVKRLETNAGDAAIFVSSDSTGNETSEFVYLLAQYFADTYPSYTVDYYLWDDSNNVYSSAVQIQAGTGANTLKIYNCAISGTQPEYIVGSKFENAVITIDDCQLVIMNHSHNMGLDGFDVSRTPRVRIPRFIAVLSMILRRHSGAGLLMIAQNPKRDDDTMSKWADTVYECAGIMNADIADAYKAFIDAGKPASWYADNTHPNSTGQQQILTEVLKSVKGNVSPKSALSPLDIFKTNIIENGLFLNFSASIPDGFVIHNGATITKDTVNVFDPEKGYSVRVSGQSGALRFNVPDLAINKYRGRWFTLAARVFTPIGASNSSPRLTLNTTNTTGISSAPISNNGQGAWRWLMVSTYLEHDSDDLYAMVFGDTSSGGDYVSIDEMVLVAGRLPSSAS